MLTLESLAAEIAVLKAQVASLSAAKARPASTLPPPDIDGQYGNPEIRKDPPRWKGPSYVGRTYSKCPSDYLRELAGFLQWKAGKNDEDGKAKYAEYDRKDAARALAWAERNEEPGGERRDGDEPLPF